MKTKSNNKKIWISSATGLVVAISIFAVIQNVDPITESIKKKILYRFKLRDVEWKENSSGNLSDRVTPQMLWNRSGLIKDVPIFSYDMNQIQQRILTIPWIDSVEIHLKLNSGFSVEYTTHKARAIFVKDKRPWIVSTTGHAIAPLESTQKQLDLPVLSGFDLLSDGLKWLDGIENVLSTDPTQAMVQIHEVAKIEKIIEKKIEILLELSYASQLKKVAAYFDDGLGLRDDATNRQIFTRLKQTVQYLIKNNILVSSIDLRAGQKVVVKVGKGL